MCILYVDQAVLEFTEIRLALPSGCWNQRLEPPLPISRCCYRIPEEGTHCFGLQFQRCQSTVRGSDKGIEEEATARHNIKDILCGCPRSPGRPTPLLPAYCGAIKGAVHSLGQSSGESVIPERPARTCSPVLRWPAGLFLILKMRINQPSVRDVGFRITPDAETCTDFGLRTTSWFHRGNLKRRECLLPWIREQLEQTCTWHCSMCTVLSSALD